jgi:hypothetical protein
MIELTLEEIKPDHFIVRGDKVVPAIERKTHRSPKTDINVIGLDDPLDQLISLIEELPHDTLIYAIGNQVGAGQQILELISTYKHNG